MYVVTGVSGNTGSVVADTLLAKKAAVRVVVRRPEQGVAWKAKGADVAVAAFDDPLAMARAFQGAKGAYLLMPPDMRATDYLADRRVLADRLARAVASSGLPHVVFLSSMGAQHPSGTGIIQGLHNAEKAFESVGRAVTHVRAGYFVENWAAVLPVARQQGVLPTFFAPEAPVVSVSVADIGRTAAQALLDGPRGRRVLELSGPTDPSANDVAAALTELLGKPVKPAPAPLDAVVPTFTSFGISENVATLFRGLYEGFTKGLLAWEGKNNEPVRGAIPIKEGLRALLG